MQDLASPHADQFAVVLSRFPPDLDLDRLALEHKALEQIAPDWNRAAIQGRVNLLANKERSVFSHAESALVLQLRI
jgi:hypothetical protein